MYAQTRTAQATETNTRWQQCRIICELTESLETKWLQLESASFIALRIWILVEITSTIFLIFGIAVAL